MDRSLITILEGRIPRTNLITDLPVHANLEKKKKKYIWSVAVVSDSLFVKVKSFDEDTCALFQWKLRFVSWRGL